MFITDLEYLEPASSPIDIIAGRKLVLTATNAHTSGGFASVGAVAIAVGDYSRTYTSTRTSVRFRTRKTRKRSFSYGSSKALGFAYAAALLGHEADISTSANYDSYIT